MKNFLGFQMKKETPTIATLGVSPLRLGNGPKYCFNYISSSAGASSEAPTIES